MLKKLCFLFFLSFIQLSFPIFGGDFSEDQHHVLNMPYWSRTQITETLQNKDLEEKIINIIEIKLQKHANDLSEPIERLSFFLTYYLLFLCDARESVWNATQETVDPISPLAGDAAFKFFEESDWNQSYAIIHNLIFELGINLRQIYIGSPEYTEYWLNQDKIGKKYIALNACRSMLKNLIDKFDDPRENNNFGPQVLTLTKLYAFAYLGQSELIIDFMKYYYRILEILKSNSDFVTNSETLWQLITKKTIGNNNSSIEKLIESLFEAKP